MKNKTYIYTLSCPETGNIRYVGKSNDPKSRFRKHLKMVDNNQLKNHWISKLISNDLIPILTIIDEVDINEWKEKEKCEKYPRNKVCKWI